MATYQINNFQTPPGSYQQTVNAANYRQEGEYFVFYADASHTKKLLTVKATIVETIDTAD